MMTMIGPQVELPDLRLFTGNYFKMEKLRCPQAFGRQSMYKFHVVRGKI